MDEMLIRQIKQTPLAHGLGQQDRLLISAGEPIRLPIQETLISVATFMISYKLN